MKRFVAASVLAFVLCPAAAPVWGGEADELREKAKAVQREAEQLNSERRKGEAEELQRHAKELLRAAQEHSSIEKSAKAGKLSPKNEVEQLEQRLKEIAEKEADLKKAGNKDGLAELQRHRGAIEQELKQLRNNEKQLADKRPAEKPPVKKGIEFTTESRTEPADGGGLRRIRRVHVSVHVDVDVSHEEAGIRNDRAEKATKRAEAPATERVLAPQAKPGSKADTKQPTSQVEDLRRELQELRAELKELRGELKKHP